MISEGSYYTEDWSNDAENSALIRNKLSFTKYSDRKQLFEIIFHNVALFYCIFDGEQKRLILETKISILANF